MVAKARETLEQPMKIGSAIIYGLITLAIVGALFVGVFKAVAYNTYTLPKVNKECIIDNEKRIIKLESDTDHIKSMMTEQREDTKELKSDVKEILRELK